jgi:1-acyl-sn-glycerol-3-phosphate acyltransferase
MMVFTALLGQGVLAGWHLTTAIWITPFIILAPLIGYFSNALPRRRVLVASAAFGLIVVLGASMLGLSPVVRLALIALGSAIYSPVRYAMLPAAARDCRLPLPRVNGWMEMGGAAAIVLGALLGVNNSSISPTTLLVALNCVCLASALPVGFVSDTVRPESPKRALFGFFTDFGRVWRDREARSSLLALASFQAIVTAGSGALLTLILRKEDFVLTDLLRALLLVGIGAAVGCGVAALQGHPRRCLGLVPFGATGLLAALASAGIIGGIPPVPCFLLGFMGGLINVPLRSVYLAAVPNDARGNATAVMNAAIYIVTTLLAIVLYGLIEAGALATPAYQFAFLAVLSGVGALIAWIVLFSQALEVVVELVIELMYRVHARGPGADQLPHRGPLLLVANHAAYLDPFWIAKVVPRQVRPMMTSAFYDLPVVRWLSRHVARAIRVPYGSFRREAPELKEAIAALRAGECVVIFPEGMLRRSEHINLRALGRGVWQILHELPDTPVSICWVEGSWGSYFSFKNGPPGQGKPFDRFRPIDIAFTEPRPLDPGLLGDHLATRAWLRQAVLNSRGYLDLPVLPAEEESAAKVDEASRDAGDEGRPTSN